MSFHDNGVVLLGVPINIFVYSFVRHISNGIGSGDIAMWLTTHCLLRLTIYSIALCFTDSAYCVCVCVCLLGDVLGENGRRMIRIGFGRLSVSFKCTRSQQCRPAPGVAIPQPIPIVLPDYPGTL